MDLDFSIVLILFCSFHLFCFFFKPLSDILFGDKAKVGYIILIQILFELTLILLTILGWTNAYSLEIICVLLGIPISVINNKITEKKKSKNEVPITEIIHVKEIIIKCPKCGYKANFANDYCPKCGQKLEKKAFCPSCDAEIDNKNKFCSKCGKNLEVDKKIVKNESEFEICNKCGAKQTKKDALYCRKCGNKL